MTAVVPFSREVPGGKSEESKCVLKENEWLSGNEFSEYYDYSGYVEMFTLVVQLN
jgi:hypothetical protein